MFDKRDFTYQINEMFSMCLNSAVTATDPDFAREQAGKAYGIAMTVAALMENMTDSESYASAGTDWARKREVEALNVLRRIA